MSARSLSISHLASAESSRPQPGDKSRSRFAPKSRRLGSRSWSSRYLRAPGRVLTFTRSGRSSSTSWRVVFGSSLGTRRTMRRLGLASSFLGVCCTASGTLKTGARGCWRSTSPVVSKSSSKSSRLGLRRSIGPLSPATVHCRGGLSNFGQRPTHDCAGPNAGVSISTELALARATRPSPCQRARRDHQRPTAPFRCERAVRARVPLCAKSGAATLTVQMRFDSRHRGAPVDPAHLVSDA